MIKNLLRDKREMQLENNLIQFKFKIKSNNQNKNQYKIMHKS